MYYCFVACLDSYPFIADSSVCMKGCELIGNTHEVSLNKLFVLYYMY